MGGWNASVYRTSPVEKLAGKSNYPTWNPTVLMELRANKVAKAITLKTAPVNPDELGAEEINTKIQEWLSE